MECHIDMIRSLDLTPKPNKSNNFKQRLTWSDLLCFVNHLDLLLEGNKIRIPLRRPLHSGDDDCLVGGGRWPWRRERDGSRIELRLRVHRTCPRSGKER